MTVFFLEHELGKCGLAIKCVPNLWGASCACCSPTAATPRNAWGSASSPTAAPGGTTGLTWRPPDRPPAPGASLRGRRPWRETCASRRRTSGTACAPSRRGPLPGPRGRPSGRGETRGRWCGSRGFSSDERWPGPRFGRGGCGGAAGAAAAAGQLLRALVRRRRPERPRKTWKRRGEHKTEAPLAPRGSNRTSFPSSNGVHLSPCPYLHLLARLLKRPRTRASRWRRAWPGPTGVWPACTRKWRGRSDEPNRPKEESAAP